MKAIGLVELPNCTDAIQALDVMLKTADVQFLTWEKKLGGRLVTLIVQGNVAAVDRSSGSCKTQSRRTRGGFHSDCKSARRNLEVDRGQQKEVSISAGPGKNFCLTDRS